MKFKRSIYTESIEYTHSGHPFRLYRIGGPARVYYDGLEQWADILEFDYLGRSKDNLMTIYSNGHMDFFLKISYGLAMMQSTQTLVLPQGKINILDYVK